MKTKLKSIELVLNLYNAMNELSNHWTEGGQENSDFLAENGYPFEKSLDDLVNMTGHWLNDMEAALKPKNGEYKTKGVDDNTIITNYKNGLLHGAAIIYYPNTEQIEKYLEFHEGRESSPAVYFSETGTIVSVDNTLDELTPDTIGSFLRRILKMTAHDNYNGFKLQYEGLSDTLYLEDTKHDNLEININITKEGISFGFDYENGHIFLGHEFPKNSEEIEEYINKFHNIYAHTVTQLHNTLIANVRVFA
jgi:hypothetical protein